ncbi:hypothetical protein [Mesorhizobium huakuii]|uniref:hypothetical protein n=1 Tax=Mesorhizobium huakuii TaxID=28104 RepID=UPI0024E096E5|nr:hypothetical protein [Mesorhizobium huakuii]
MNAYDLGRRAGTMLAEAAAGCKVSAAYEAEFSAYVEAVAAKAMKKAADDLASEGASAFEIDIFQRSAQHSFRQGLAAVGGSAESSGATH